MIEFNSLFSGSGGNSYFLKIDGKKYLIDVGMSRKKIIEQLEKINEKIEDIEGIFITHEHIDHIRGLQQIAKKDNIPIYIRDMTFKEIQENEKTKIEIPLEYINILDKNDLNLEKNGINFTTFGISHDAIDPVGFSFFDNDKNKITIVTDLGIINDDVRENLKDNKILVLESNYDEELIKYSPYPYKTKVRIMSNKGHLSNEQASSEIIKLAKNGLENINLGHLSQNNNNELIVMDIFENKFCKEGIDISKLNLKILNNKEPGEKIIIE